MKHLRCFFLFSVWLSACSSAAFGPQATITSTATPSPIPTITLTPTATPDPNRPADAMDQDPETGEYTKTVEQDGRTVEYVWRPFQFGTDAANGVQGHWFESRMSQGPINLTGYGENGYSDWPSFPVPFSMYAVEGLHDLDEIGYLYHPDGPSDYVTNDLQHNTLASTITFDLFLNYYDLLPENLESYGRDRFAKLKEKYPDYNYYEDGVAFANDIKQGGTIAVGDELWQPIKGYELYWIDETMAADDPSMQVSLQSYTTKNFYWKVMVQDEKLIAVIAPSSWLKNQLVWPKARSREDTFRSIALFLLQAIVNGADPNGEIYFLPFQHYGSMAGPDVSIRTPDKTITITTSFIAFTQEP